MVGRAKKSELSVFSVSLRHHPHKAMHNHPYHEFYFSLSEEGTQYAADASYPLRRQQLFTLPSPVYHFCHADRNDTQVNAVVIYIHPEVFSGNGFADRDARRMLLELVKRGREGQHDVPMSSETGAQLEQILVPLSQRNVRTAPGYALEIRSGVEQMLVALMRDPAFSRLFLSKPPGADQRLDQVFYYVDNHFSEVITIEDMATLAGLSRSHFHALFRKTADCTFIDYLIEVRIQNACDLLQYGDLPLTEVGWACGFESVPHFYRCFRKMMDVPPGTYRKQALSPAS